MSLIIIALLILGLILLAIELFVVPGFGALGILGIICIIAAGFITVFTVPGGVVIVSLAGCALCAIGLLAMRYLRTHQLFGRMILNENLNSETPEFGNLEQFLGKTGMTEIPLRPYGKAAFDGISLDVFSDGGYVQKGRTVKVVEVHDQKVIVKETN